jgi:hypothetical protein
VSESTEPTEPAEPTAPVDPQPADPAAQPKDLAAEVEKWKDLSRKNEARAKANADAAKRLAEIEDAAKSEADKLAERLTAAEDRVKAATAMAVAARVQAAATGRFADAQDAVEELGRRGADFLDATGQIDGEAIETALADLLERKPHWGVAAPSGPRTPAPDPAQGARPGSVPTLAAQIREAEEKGDITRSIALKSRQLRELQQTNRK